MYILVYFLLRHLNWIERYSTIYIRLFLSIGTTIFQAYIIKKWGIILILCESLHDWLLTQSLFIAMVSSLITQQRIRLWAQ